MRIRILVFNYFCLFIDYFLLSLFQVIQCMIYLKIVFFHFYLFEDLTITKQTQNSVITSAVIRLLYPTWGLLVAKDQFIVFRNHDD